MNPKLIILAATLGSLCLPVISAAQSGAPPELAEVFDPLPTRIEQHPKSAVVRFGDRSYRLEPVAHRDGTRTRVVGKIIRRKVTSRGQWERVNQTYGDDYVTVLPGFGLALSSKVSGSKVGQQIHYIMRGADGAVNPPIPSNYDEDRPVLVRSGVRPDGLTAERTLIVLGPRTDYKLSGSGAAKTAILMEQPVAFAWLFDGEGLAQSWTRLQNIGGDWTATGPQTGSRYVQHSAAGHLIFATAGEDDTLNVHSLGTDLKTHRVIAGVKMFHQQTEKPNIDHVTVNSIGAHVFEKTGVHPGFYTTVLLAPLGLDGWFGVLEADGSITVPEGAIGMRPLMRSRRYVPSVSGEQPTDYSLIYGFLVAYDTADGRRYGWSSPRMTASSGPLWKDVRIVTSERIPKDTTVQTGIDPRLVVAQHATGEWQVYAEPKVQLVESTFLEPNTFSGLIPPAATLEEAVTLAEAVFVSMDRLRSREARQRFESTMAVIRAERQEESRRKAVAMQERERAWAEVGRVLREWGKTPLPPGPTAPTSKPSALGPDYHWFENKLIYKPTNREVK